VAAPEPKPVGRSAAACTAGTLAHAQRLEHERLGIDRLA
jgi:hypothetical protein